jgi:hypothetical protein
VTYDQAKQLTPETLEEAMEKTFWRFAGKGTLGAGLPETWEAVAKAAKLHLSTEAKGEESGPAIREALEACAHALMAVDDWLGSASTRQYALDALWLARRRLEAAGVDFPRDVGLGWRGSVFRALEKCGLGWTGYEDEIRFRLAGQPNWAAAAGPALHGFLEASWKFIELARSLQLERPGSYYWLDEPLAKVMGIREGCPELPVVCTHCGGEKVG